MLDVLRIVTAVVGFFVVFITIWFIVVRNLGLTMGMTKHFGEVNMGSLIKGPNWGSARVNGVRCKNSISVTIYEHGILLSMMWLFGGGMKWIDKGDIEAMGDLQQDILFLSRRELSYKGGKIIFYGKLAEMFEGDEQHT